MFELDEEADRTYRNTRNARPMKHTIHLPKSFSTNPQRPNFLVSCNDNLEDLVSGNWGHITIFTGDVTLSWESEGVRLVYEK